MATPVDKTVGAAVHEEDVTVNEKFTGAVLNEYAKEAAIAEHQQTVWEACKIYKKALFWSFICSMCVVMEG
jgi:MFS transporter, SP family, general alpha glucoside:H+ symporter